MFLSVIILYLKSVMNIVIITIYYNILTDVFINSSIGIMVHVLSTLSLLKAFVVWVVQLLVVVVV